MFIFNSKTTISLIPGPKVIDWIADSQEIHSFENINLKSIFDSIANLEGVTGATNESQDPYEWKVILSPGPGRQIEFGFSPFESEDGDFWGGSPLQANCYFEDLLKVWLEIRQMNSSIWIHDSECKIYRPESFIDVFVARLLESSDSKEIILSELRRTVEKRI